MKTREIDVWYCKEQERVLTLDPCGNTGQFIKSRLIIPVEPIKREFESELDVLRIPDRLQVVIRFWAEENEANLNMNGKKFHIVMTELQNENA